MLLYGTASPPVIWTSTREPEKPARFPLDGSSSSLANRLCIIWRAGVCTSPNTCFGIVRLASAKLLAAWGTNPKQHYNRAFRLLVGLHPAAWRQAESKNKSEGHSL
jgi:hypothetical protein